MTSMIEDHTHNYGNIKGILLHMFSLGSIANQSLNVYDTAHHENTANTGKDLERASLQCLQIAGGSFLSSFNQTTFLWLLPAF